MATYNGASFLPAQLDSFLSQTVANWSLHVSDDNSTDETVSLLEAFQNTVVKEGCAVHIYSGPGKGAAENFLSLLRHQETDPGWVAFSDQDDIWLPERLERGMLALNDVNGPALYCSRTWIFSGETPIRKRLSASRPRPPSFRNALVQNIASGNTILLNPAAAKLVRAAAEITGQVVVHDWWIYQLVTGAGGRVLHDDTPTLFYRQHADNGIGSNDTAMAKLRRIWQLLSGDFKRWNDVNISALEKAAGQLSASNRDTLEHFKSMRHARFFQRIIKFRRLKLIRQSRSGAVALWFAVTFSRL